MYLTREQIGLINHIINQGDHVELYMIKDEIQIVQIKRKKVKPTTK